MTLPVARGGQQETVVFRAGAETDVRLPVRVRYTDLVEVLKRRPDPDHIPYLMTARLQVQTPVGEMLIPLEKSDSFSVPEPLRPGYYLEGIKELLH